MKPEDRNQKIQFIKKLMQGVVNLDELSDEENKSFKVTLHLGPGSNPDGSHPNRGQWQAWQEQVRREIPVGGMYVTLNL